MKNIIVQFKDKTSKEDVYQSLPELKDYLIYEMFPGKTLKFIVNRVANTVGYGDIYIDDGGADPITGDYRGYDYIIAITKAKDLLYDDLEDPVYGQDGYLFEVNNEIYFCEEYVS